MFLKSWFKIEYLIITCLDMKQDSGPISVKSPTWNEILC